MDKNTELLNYVLQNSQMGVESLSQLVDIANDQTFCQHLKTQLGEYQSIYDEARAMIHASGQEEKGVSPMTKGMAKLSIGMKTMRDQTPSHISEMIIQGSTMGVIDATKNQKEYATADPNILALNNRLLQIEQNNIDLLKKYL